MFKVNDFVVKMKYGVFQIVGEEVKQFTPGAPKEKYFLLKSIDGKLTAYQPVESADELLRPVMTKDEAKEFISDLSREHYVWNNDDKTRVVDTKKRTDATPSVEVLGLAVGGYYKRLAEGKSISRSDKAYLESIEAKLFPVLGFSLGCENDEVREKFYEAFKVEREDQA